MLLSGQNVKDSSHPVIGGVACMQAKSLAQNTTFLTISSALQKVVAFVYYSFLAKGIGPAETGKYNFALIFTGVFILFMDFGLGPVLTREGARHEDQIEQKFRQTLGLKIILIVLSLLGMAAVVGFGLVRFKNIDSTDLQLISLAGLVIILDTLTFTLLSTFRAFRNLSVESMAIVLYQLIIFGCGMFVITRHLPTPFLVLALLAGSLSNFIFVAILLKIRTHISFKPIFNWSVFKSLLKLSIPFALAGAFFKLSGSVDSLLLKVLSENRFVGWYGLAYKLSFALTVLPGSFASSFFPQAAATFETHKEQLGKLFEKATVYMFILSIPIVVGIFFLGDNLIYSVYGQAWEASILPLQILATGLIFSFWNYPVGNLLNAVNKQLLNTTNMGIALVVNIALNLLLIPKYTFVGAAIANALSAVVLVSLGLPHVKKFTHFSWRLVARKTFGIIAAGAVMGGVAVLLESVLKWYIVALICGCVYLVALRMIGVVSKADVQPIIRKVWNR